MLMLFSFPSLESKFFRTSRVEAVQDFDPVETALGLSLPADYKSFLMWANGGETMPPLDHVTFYPLADLLSDRSVPRPPDTLEFATDDSDAYAFDLRVGRRSASYPVVSYPLSEASREELEFVADGFRKFLEVLLDPAARYRKA